MKSNGYLCVINGKYRRANVMILSCEEVHAKQTYRNVTHMNIL